jgi:hypothetical protein
MTMRLGDSPMQIPQPQRGQLRSYATKRKTLHGLFALGWNDRDSEQTEIPGSQPVTLHEVGAVQQNRTFWEV